MMVSTLAPDPYVRVALVNGGDTVVEATTRVIFRNRNPVFEESVLLPLRGMPLDERSELVATVWDYDAVMDKMLGKLKVRTCLVCDDTMAMTR